jgi:hypothetical protein
MRKAPYIILGAGMLIMAILMVPHETYAGFLPRVTPPATRPNVNGTGGYDYSYYNQNMPYYRATSTTNYSNYYFTAYTQSGRKYSCFYE